MTVLKKILIVKHGALGDVVRTSFFAKPIRNFVGELGDAVRLYWFTSHGSLQLLRYNPFVDVVTTNLADLKPIDFDVVYSLDDESEILRQVAELNTAKIVGARIDENGTKTYCEQSSYWFDMGLLSKYGKEHADQAKRTNRLTHSEIFKKIFGVSELDLSFYNSEALNVEVENSLIKLANGKIPIGLNAFAGKRWPSKSLPDTEFSKLVEELAKLKINGQGVHVFLIGSGEDFLKNQEHAMLAETPKNVSALNTDVNVLELAAAVRVLKLLVTTDSLCLHLATSQQVPTIAFFAPTSAAEIENVTTLKKIISCSDDYCSYKPDANNSTITCDRIMEEINLLLEVNLNA